MPSMTFFNKMSGKDKAMLFTSLSYMLTAGMTAKEGINVIMNDPSNRINKKSLQVAIDSLDEGNTLSQMFHANENIFGAGIWRQIDAAERTGKVPECLLRIANQIKQNGDSLSKIRGAMIYPGLILSVAIIAGYYMLTTTVPQMGEMMAELGAELPGITKALISFCDLLVNHLVLILLCLFGVVATFIYLINNPLKLQWHYFITKFPISSSISINLNYSTVYLLINDMHQNGASTVESLRVAGSSATNYFIYRELMACADAIDEHGYSLTRVLLEASTMPHDDRLMLNVGARTGREMEVLSDLAVRRKAAADDAIGHLVELISPLLMGGVSAMVGVMVIGIYMPMLTIASQVL